jgi:DNA mismatch repair protein MutS
VSRSALETPMMRQYLAVKAQHPDAFLFYRMGDFYELFLEDAERAAPLLDIALTTRDRGKPDAVPMCGVPVHGAAPYLKRLADLGHRVALCEQVEDARAAGGRRLVRREVVEVITPGLVGDPEGLEAASEVVVAAIEPPAGLAALEASTGDFRCTAVGEAPDDPAGLPAALLEELRRIAPREVLIPEAVAPELAARVAAAFPGAAVTRVPGASYDPAAAPAEPAGFERDATDPGIRAAAALLAYLAANQPFALPGAARLRRYALGDAMELDAATRAHLELFESAEDRTRRATLIERLDETVTALGARRLARWLAYPLVDPGAIAARQDAVTWLVERDRLRAQVRERARPVRDLERIFAKATRPSATPRDLAALRASLAALPGLAEALGGGEGDAWLPGSSGERPASLPVPAPVPEAWQLLEDALVEDPPAVPRGSRGASEVGYIRAGFRAELDALRDSARKGREWIAGLEARERERTGIANLKVRYHPVHGYALEITRANLSRVPGGYERKQTLANAERFTTPELREMEQRVMGAHDRAAALEREIFESVRAAALAHGPSIAAAAAAVAEVDALASLAEVARRDGWVRPSVDAGERLEIRAGRHPVIEPLLARRGEEFVPNDAELDPGEVQIVLLTGPNMSGKSTYLRQVAQIVLLAQMGSYVPAASARVGVVDRIFTRVGASDRLARGDSTFMVEMRETAEILARASRRSLVILDEIGRGTSTFDGLSIAWAVAEYLHDTPGLGARTLFATHYHELTELAATRPRFRNAHFEVREWRGDVVFLRRLAAGGASRSYGIQVARLAGLPERVIARAREVLAELESAGGRGGAPPQLSLFGSGVREPEAPDAAPAAGEREVLDELRGCDPDRTTPVDALLLLRRWRERLGGEEGP